VARTQTIRTRPARFKLRPGFFILAIIIGGLLYWSFSPARLWLKEQREIEILKRKLVTLRTKNRTLEEEIARLKTDAYIEQLARRELGLVKPGETAYIVIPSSEKKVSNKPETKPLNESVRGKPSWWQKVVSFFKNTLASL